jgi:hypothetical protein
LKQSSLIVAALLAAFVLFLAARGRLPLYASVLWGPKPTATPPASNAGGNSERGSGGFELPDFGDMLPDLGDMFGDFDLGDIAKAIPFFI